MKNLFTILLFAALFAHTQGQCQSRLDLKIDSLTRKLELLRGDKEEVESQIQLASAEINKLYRLRLTQSPDSLIKVTCAPPFGVTF